MAKPQRKPPRQALIELCVRRALLRDGEVVDADHLSDLSAIYGKDSVENVRQATLHLQNIDGIIAESLTEHGQGFKPGESSLDYTKRAYEQYQRAKRASRTDF